MAFRCRLLDPRLPEGDGFDDGDGVGVGLAGRLDGDSDGGVAGIYTHPPPCRVALGIVLLKFKKVETKLSLQG